MVGDAQDKLDDLRISDSLLGEAWENTEAIYRAAIKNAIAITDFHFGHIYPEQTLITQQQHAGYWQKTSLQPVKRVFILFTPQYVAAARLCAAAILPVLCDVENVAAICIGMDKPASGILNTLELCGIEDIYQVQNNAAFWDNFFLTSQDRVLLLHGDESRELSLLLRQNDMVFYEEIRDPRIYIHPSLNISLQMLYFLHGHFVRLQSPQSADAILCQEQDIKDLEIPADIPLLLTAGCEGFWLHPNLFPQFFMTTSHTFGMISRNTDKPD